MKTTATTSSTSNSNVTPITTATSATSPTVKPQASDDPAMAALMAELAAARAENDKLKADASKPKAVNGLKVTEKGGLSVYGLGSFPVTLYREQWVALLAMKDKIEAELNAPQHQPAFEAAAKRHADTKATKKAEKATKAAPTTSTAQ